MNIERVERGGVLLALIISGGPPDSTEFFTPDDANLQVGYVTRRGGETIDRHAHHPVERNTRGTAEVLVTVEGTAEIDVYDEDREFVSTHTLRTGDVCVMLKGAHGFRTIEDTVFLEVKQGPYGGLDEKERF